MALSAAKWLPRAVTAALLAMSLAAIPIWTRNIGIQEDWFMVAPWLGHEPDLLEWLWSQNNEHRLPVGRLIYLGLLKATNDFRSGMVASQLLMATLTLLLIHLLVRARGGVHRVSDALFPLALLHLGHWENLLWGWQIQFVSSTFLTGLLLAAAISSPLPSLAAGSLAAVAFVLLPLSGANGIAVALGMFPWAVVAAFFRFRGGDADPRAAWVLVSGMALSTAASIAYFIGYVHPWWSPPPANWEQFLVAAKAYFAMATGSWSRTADAPVAAFVLIISVTAALLALASFWRTRSCGDARSFGLAVFIGSNLLLGIIIAVSRGAYAYPLPARYAVFASMPFLAALIALQLYAPARLGRGISAAVALGLLVVLPLNIASGFVWRDWYVQGMVEVERDLANGLPLAAIADRNTDFLLHSCDGCLLRAITLLHDAGIAPFASAIKQPSDQAISTER